MSTPKDVFAEIDQRLKADPAATKEIDGAFKFDVSGADGGVWVVDCRTVEVKEGDGDADVTIAVSDEDLVDIGLISDGMGEALDELLQAADALEKARPA